MVQVGFWNRSKDVITAACWTFLELQRKREHGALHMDSFESSISEGSAVFLEREQCRQEKTGIPRPVSFSEVERGEHVSRSSTFLDKERNVWIFDEREKDRYERPERFICVFEGGDRCIHGPKAGSDM
jgi:hypothetical protein